VTKTSSVRVEIYDQPYNLRGADPDSILRLAEYVDTKMRLISQQTNTVDSLRLAILAAVNIADELQALKRKYDSIAGDYNRRTQELAGALDAVLAEQRLAG
jgi:cell division protein ZapA